MDISRFRDLSLDDDVEAWHERVLARMPKVSFDRDLMGNSMLLVAAEGLNSVLVSADQQGVAYEDADLEEARRYAFDYIEDRLDAIEGNTPPRETVENDVRNPWLEAGIDIATAMAIAHLLRRTLRSNQTDEQEWSEVYYASIAGAVIGRATLIAWDLLGKSFANGIIGFVSRFLPVQKTWLETTSKKPRDEHLAIVGETVPYNETFSHGQFWSQESYNCKCGIAITFGR